MPNFTNFNQSIINLSKFINEYLCTKSDELKLRTTNNNNKMVYSSSLAISAFKISKKMYYTHMLQLFLFRYKDLNYHTNNYIYDV